MLDFEAISFEADIRETYWIGDPAVDSAATDLSQWRETGEGVIPLPQEKPTLIRWRPLYPREKLEAARLAGLKKLPDGTIDPVQQVIFMHEAARFGIVSVDGMRMGWDRFHGVRGLDDASMHQLDLLEIDNTSPVEALRGLRFLTWIGGLISSGSFRDPG